MHSQINDQVKQNPEIGRMITTMEENYDENFRTSDIAVPLSRRDAHNVPSRDEIGALFERSSTNSKACAVGDTARQIAPDRYCVTNYDAAPRAAVDNPQCTNEQYE